MPRAFVIAGKDLRQRLRDRSAIVLSIIAPFGLALILGSLLPEENELEFHRYAVVDLDRGPVARTFVEDVLGGFDRDANTEIIPASSPQEAARLAEDDEIAAAWIVPAGFSDAAGSIDRPATIEVIGNSEARIATQVAEAVAAGFASELNAVRLSLATALEPGTGPPDPTLVAELRDRALGAPSPIVVEQDPATRRELSSTTFFAAGMAVFFLFFTAQFGALSLLAERREGTLARLVAAPISPGSIVMAKALSTFVFGTVAMTVLIVTSTLALGADFGEPLGVAALVLGAVIAAMGLTSLVAGPAKTEAQAAGFGSILAVTLGILGGTFFPLSQAPGFLAVLSQLTPHYWVMRGFADLAGPGGPADVVLPATALVAFGLVTGGLALALARRAVTRP